VVETTPLHRGGFDFFTAICGTDPVPDSSAAFPSLPILYRSDAYFRMLSATVLIGAKRIRGDSFQNEQLAASV
jgi:hypothetical protein